MSKIKGIGRLAKILILSGVKKNLAFKKFKIFFKTCFDLRFLLIIS